MRLDDFRYRMPQPRELLSRCVDVVLSPWDASAPVIGRVPGIQACALTFDDGPSPHNTPEILDLLEEYGAKATFFVVGERISRCEPIVERIVNLGHEVGNHTNTHPHTVYLTRDQLRSEIVQANEAIAALDAKVRFVRPPFGKDRRRIASIAEELGMRVALWSIDSGDASGYPAGDIISSVVRSARPGAVILLHDGGSKRTATIDACRRIVPALREAGLHLVTLSELAETERGLAHAS
jgi:peptidoglycan-N-acetylglucosamine deacetylase